MKKDKLFTLVSYIQHFFTARNEHSLHSPFMFHLYQKGIKRDKTLNMQLLEQLRESLLTDNTLLIYKELGAGSKTRRQKRVRDIAKYSLSSKKKLRLLSQLAQTLRPAKILELGTSLGLSSIAFQISSPHAKVTTIEGVKVISDMAEKNMENTNTSKIQLLNGSFDDVLPEFLRKEKTFDLIYIDGNHKKAPTLRYYDLLTSHCHEDTLIIFDDIYWSKEMFEAWQDISSRPEVRITVDLFDVGLVFFRDKQPKQHFKLRY